MALTIDKLDVGIYIQYARRTEMIEKINQQYRLQEASSIPPQISLVSLYPQLTELDLLLGVGHTLSPWAYFFPPPSFKYRRRSPFTFSRILPHLDDQEREDGQSDEDRLANIACSTLEEKNEKAALANFLKTRTKINDWLMHIVKQVGRFIRG